MQQTENYKLNLIETSDTFSPTPLNENTRAIDAALLKFASGTYDGDGQKTRKIDLPFTPKLVYVGNEAGTIITYNISHRYLGGLAVPGHPAVFSGSTLVEIAEGGFQVFHYNDVTSTNSTTYFYRYFAIG